jgi:hypothetical protein
MHVPPTEARAAHLGPRFIALLAVALVAHGALLWMFVLRVLDIRHPVEPLAAEFAYVTLPTLACAALLLWRFPRHSPAVAATMIFVTAAALLSPGVVLTVGAMILSAYVVGERLLALVRDPVADDPALPPVVPALAGTALWIGLIAVALPLRIHVLPVYAALMLAPLLIFRRTAARAITDCAGWLTRSREPMRWTERAWTAVLVVLASLYLFLVARPEVGYDAQTMHLHFAQLLREQRQWNFDVTRYAWAVMPLGADLGFAAAYLLGGEAAARFLNFTFGAAMLLLAYRLTAAYARREIALAMVALLASTPLVVLESATLYVENLWTAFLLAALLLVLRFQRAPRRETLCAFAFAVAGAMQCKIIGAIWIAPLCGAIAWLAWRSRAPLGLDGPTVAQLALAAALAAWPYANAWIRTGNPGFPFVNAVFKSPYFDTSASFNNPIWNVPLSPWSPYEIVLSSGRFIEGTDGALGAHWLLLIPVALLGLIRGRPRAQWLSLSLAVFFFVVVYMQQSYLRYLLPALVLLAVFSGWVLHDLPDTRVLRVTLLAVGIALCAANLRMMPAASYANARLCLKCSFDAEARRSFILVFAPLRALGEELNRVLPEARVGFMLLHAPSPGNFVGYSRSANWHDWTLYSALIVARNGDDVRNLLRAHRLSHIVYSAGAPGALNDAIRAFAAEHATPLWRSRDYIVAAIRPD